MKIRLKKTLTLILVSLFIVCNLIGLVGCSKNSGNKVVDDYKLYLNDTFNSTLDLSDCQGYRNWYYYCGDPENNTLASLVFNEFSGRWCSEYQNLDKETYIWGTAWLPSPLGGIGMGFKAPATGTVQVKVVLELLGESGQSGDGVVFTITDYNGESYDCKSLPTAKAGIKQVLENTIEVKLGDSILFMLFANTDNINDFTNVDITINYVEK